MGILIVLSVVLSASALLLAIFALNKIYDHDAFHHFVTQPTVIKYPDKDLEKRVNKLEERLNEKKIDEDNMATCKAIGKLYNIIDSLERTRDPETYDGYVEALVMAIESLSKETKNDK